MPVATTTASAAEATAAGGGGLQILLMKRLPTIVALVFFCPLLSAPAVLPLSALFLLVVQLSYSLARLVLEHIGVSDGSGEQVWVAHRRRVEPPPRPPRRARRGRLREHARPHGAPRRAARRDHGADDGSDDGRASVSACEYVKRLGIIKNIRSLRREAVLEWASCVVRLAPGDALFTKGETSRELLFLVQGEVQVFTRSTGRVESRLTPTRGL